jgi:hypothetical protein
MEAAHASADGSAFPSIGAAPPLDTIGTLTGMLCHRQQMPRSRHAGVSLGRTSEHTRTVRHPQKRP